MQPAFVLKVKGNKKLNDNPGKNCNYQKRLIFPKWCMNNILEVFKRLQQTTPLIFLIRRSYPKPWLCYGATLVQNQYIPICQATKSQKKKLVNCFFHCRNTFNLLFQPLNLPLHLLFISGFCEAFKKKNYPQKCHLKLTTLSSRTMKAID